MRALLLVTLLGCSAPFTVDEGAASDAGSRVDVLLVDVVDVVDGARPGPGDVIAERSRPPAGLEAGDSVALSDAPDVGAIVRDTGPGNADSSAISDAAPAAADVVDAGPPPPPRCVFSYNCTGNYPLLCPSGACCDVRGCQ